MKFILLISLLAHSNTFILRPERNNSFSPRPYASSVIVEKNSSGEDIYYVYIRNCGKLKVNLEGEYSNGDRVMVTMKSGRGCKIDSVE